MLLASALIAITADPVLISTFLLNHAVLILVLLASTLSLQSVFLATHSVPLAVVPWLPTVSPVTLPTCSLPLIQNVS